MAKKQTLTSTSPAARTNRPPIVAVVGHIDHGKSTLLDYIRHTQVTAQEAGGITQHLSAYEAEHETAHGPRQITFLDTPGHEAFTAMRSRGLSVADVAILVVSSEEGVRPQTLEAVKLIQEAKIPYIVALTKIDKPGANIERAKASLIEHGLYLEGLGGDIPYVGVSGKTGEGIPELLDLILLAADLEDLSVSLEGPAEGICIEAHVDQRRGASATLIVKNGTLRSGSFVVAESSFAPVRIMENFLGKAIREALPGSPVRIVGFSSVPPVGSSFLTVESKKEAEKMASEAAARERQRGLEAARSGTTHAPEEGEAAPTILPLIIKSDVAGTGDAVVHEIEKLPRLEKLDVRIVSRGVGSISEADVKLAAGSETPGIVVGFNVKVDAPAQQLAEREGVTIATFDIIYKLTEWLAAEFEKRRPRERQEEQIGSARILKIFSQTRRSIVLGGRVEDGTLRQGAEVRIMRRDFELGRGEIESLQSQKKQVKEVAAGSEFGAMLHTEVAVAANDRLEIFEVVFK